MFTGIISDIGEVIAADGAGDARLEIACRYPCAAMTLGASIACAGICLTVVDVRELADGRSAFAVQASAETRSRTTLGRWSVGSRINLERALKLGDELGGHMVSGHVDAVATVLSVQPEGASKRFRFRMPRGLAPLIAPKGSLSLDGTSLTVNEADGDSFGVMIIPHTLSATTFGIAREGDAVNLEVDMLARYVARLRGFQWQ
jgi:riboflavin synthase